MERIKHLIELIREKAKTESVCQMLQCFGAWGIPLKLEVMTDKGKWRKGER